MAAPLHDGVPSAYAIIVKGILMRRLLASYLLLLIFLSATGSDVLRISPVEEISVRYRFNLVGWEVANFPAKWLRELQDVVFPFTRQDGTELEDILEYFSLGDEANRLQAQINEAAAAGDATTELERQLQEVQRRRDSLRSDVERLLEAELSAALREEGIPSRIGGLIFPPVDFVLDRPPRVLSVSPRDRILLTEDIFLVPDMSVEEQEALEERISQEQEVSALVDSLGGLSTYPSFITPTDLRSTLSIAAHEWLHHYLFFRPLGQNMHRDDDIRTLNETTANVFGDELGDRIYTRITGEELPERIRGTEEECREPRFCFDREMRRTRLRVEELLDQGEILKAEAYMEERRQLFVENGYHIRKINQAYFARRGAYADDPASISPIFDQLTELRGLSDSLARFIHTVSGVSGYNGFNELLTELRG
ncbi:MAG: hypothetical protein O7D33_00290 [Chloroflexi bacterium]|nr:hypothetical protein [Chloroflexota bacterium]